MNRSFYLFVFAFILLGACSKDDPVMPSGQIVAGDGGGDSDDVNDDTICPPGELKILSVGNSYSIDAMLYVPFIMRELMPELKLTVAILGTGGRSLEKHYKYNMIRGMKYDYYYKNVDCSGWRFEPERVAKDVLNDESWDLVLMQQVSHSSFDIGSYVYAASMIDWIATATRKDVDYGWILTPAYPDGSDRLPGPDDAGIVTGFDTSEQMYEAVVDCVESFIESENRISVLCPVGTAVQNARQTSLDVCGRTCHLTYDAVHLQDGIGRTVAALAVCQSIIDYYKLDATILNSRYMINSDDFSNHCLAKQKKGSIVGMNPVNLDIAVKCAIAACRSPFTISYLSE